MSCDLPIKCKVQFGSFEHPEALVECHYLRQAEDQRFHIVERAGVPVRVHDQQLEPAFVTWLAKNPAPGGRW